MNEIMLLKGKMRNFQRISGQKIKAARDFSPTAFDKA